MPSFANPFSGNIDRKISNPELLQALRLDIAGELEAIFIYDAHYHATDDCDLNTGYLETKDFNHALRIQETVALRIKEPAAIVNFVTE